MGDVTKNAYKGGGGGVKHPEKTCVRILWMTPI